MPAYTIYDKVSGRVIQSMNCSRDELDFMLGLRGGDYIEGDYDGRVYFVTVVAGEPLAVRFDQPGIQPPEWFAESRESLLARLAAIRYGIETGGTEMDGVRILTGRTDQAMTTQVFVTLRDGLVDEIDWKGADGWHRVTLAELEPVARAVAAHAQRCFSAERAVSEQIAALPDADIPAFDLTAAWDAAWSPA